MYIKIFTVGGTIDKEYFDRKSEYEVGAPFIEEILGELSIQFKYDIQVLMQKDSLDMNNSDRQLVFNAVRDCEHHRILITHGTDKMSETAGVLRDIKDKVVVLTGSMLPGKFHKTDAVFNIAFALGSCQQLPEGVYVCMNGLVFNGSEVRKNRGKGRFEGNNIP